MRALLLAAGLGTRLRPLTNYLPKCLVPIHGRPLLDYWLEILLENGITEVLINTHYMAQTVEKYLRQSSWLPYVKVSYEESLLGTGGTLLANRTFFKDEAFLFAHADNLSIFDLKLFQRVHRMRPCGAELTMMTFETHDPHSCGIVSVDKNGLVEGFYEKVKDPPGNLANGAVYIVEPTILEWMSALGKDQVDFSTEVIPSFLNKIHTFHNTFYHRDIGTMESWIASHREFTAASPVAGNNINWNKILGANNAHSYEFIHGLLEENAIKVDS